MRTIPCLVKNGFDYAANWDASTKADSISGYKQAFDILNKDNAASKASRENTNHYKQEKMYLGKQKN